MRKEVEELVNSILLSMGSRFTVREDEFQMFINLYEMAKKIQARDIAEFHHDFIEYAVYFKLRDTDMEMSMNAIGKQTPKRLRQLLLSDYPDIKAKNLPPRISLDFFNILTEYLGYQITRFINLTDFWAILYAIGNPRVDVEYPNFINYIINKMNYIDILKNKLDAFKKYYPEEFSIFVDALKRTKPSETTTDIRKLIISRMKITIKALYFMRQNNTEAIPIDEPHPPILSPVPVTMASQVSQTYSPSSPLPSPSYFSNDEKTGFVNLDDLFE